MPGEFKLYQNYPNPFNPETVIKFSIPTPLSPPFGKGERTQSGGLITLKIFDVTGREIITLVNGEKAPGLYEVRWNASAYSSGIYFCRLVAGDYVQTRKMVLVK